MRGRVLLMSGLLIPVAAWSTTASGATEKPKEKRELLAKHETLAIFEGVTYRLCMGRTSRCPKQCGDSGEFANFGVKEYLHYEKLEQYGDSEQKSFLVQVSDYDKMPKGDPQILKTVKLLKKGDYVLLSWHHDYVTKDGSSFPERPIVKLQKIGKTEAEELMAESVSSPLPATTSEPELKLGPQ